MPDMDRHVALTKAVELGLNNDWGSEAVVLAADRFYAFLSNTETEEMQVPKPITVTIDRAPALPIFHLPVAWDDFLYYRFNDSGILYRVHRFDDRVWRLATEFDKEWELIDPSMPVGTYEKLYKNPDYSPISVSKAVFIIRNGTGQHRGLEGKVNFR